MLHTQPVGGSSLITALDRLFAGGLVAFVSWFTPKPEGQVTVPSLVGPSLSVSLWLGAALALDVLCTHCLSLSLFLTHPLLNAEAHSPPPL